MAVSLIIGSKLVVLSDLESVAFEATDGGHRVSATFGGVCAVDSLEIIFDDQDTARAVARQLLDDVTRPETVSTEAAPVAAPRPTYTPPTKTAGA